MRIPPSRILVLVLALSALSTRASAQFVGDVFFAQPSIAVAEGETGEMTIELFSGAAVHGATSFDVVFDSQELAVEHVELAPDSGYDSVTALASANSYSILAVNGDSLDDPIGINQIVTIVVRPLVPAGGVVTLTLHARSTLTATGNALAASGNFAGAISVTGASTSVIQGETMQLDHALTAYAPAAGSETPLRPAGSRLTAFIFEDDMSDGVINNEGDYDASETLYELEVSTRDPAMPSEALPADIDGDGAVSANDLAILLAAWGQSAGSPADLNIDGVVGSADLSVLLAAWGN